MRATPKGSILEFISPIDGLAHPLAVCSTDDTPGPKPLLLEVSPGAIADLGAAVALTEEIAGVARASDRSCVVVRPTGRGPGSVYQDYGEVDVLEAISFIASRYEIDPGRITVTGASMGGAATWYLLSHYPDLFAAGAPFCGYADYRLWEKPGGLTFQMRPWEEPSWRARSAALLAENLADIPIWIVHGEWDRAVGGGVSVEQSRRMAQLLGDLGAPVRYTELPRTGHDSREPAVWHQVIRWLLDQRRPTTRDRIRLATGTLRHNRSGWLTVDQLSVYGERGTVDAEIGRDARVTVTTDNVHTLTLNGPPGDGPLESIIDGQPLGTLDRGIACSYRRDPDGTWRAGPVDLSGEKRHGASGPIGDLFHERTILVPGTIGGEEATFFNDWAAAEAAWHYRSRNGGVHRGGIMGTNAVDLPIVRDVDLTPVDRTSSNFVLFGTPASNALLAEFSGSLDITAESDTISLRGRSWSGPRVSAFAIFPHPEHEARYVAMHGGPMPDAVTWGSHLDMALLPDLLVYSGGDTLDWGFWGNDWRTRA